jgi:hypothetical protein
MKLTDEQIDRIAVDLRNNGVAMDELVESLTDHICCVIENSKHHDFEQAYRDAMTEFGKFGPSAIEKNTLFLLTIKRELTMKTTMYILGYFAAILLTTGALFKMMHWFPANVLLVVGIALLNFGYLPMYFYSKYQSAVSQ